MHFELSLSSLVVYYKKTVSRIQSKHVKSPNGNILCVCSETQELLVACIMASADEGLDC